LKRPSVVIEFVARKKEKRLDGILAIPRISRNGNLYLPEELAKADGRIIPVLWNHEGTPEDRSASVDPALVIGTMKLSWDPTLMQLKYEADVDRELPDIPLHTSLGAFFDHEDHICGSSRCYAVPRGLSFVEASIVPEPGIPETTVNIRESFPVKQCAMEALSAKFPSLQEASPCVQNCLMRKHGAGHEIDDQAIAVCYSECGESLENLSWTEAHALISGNSLTVMTEGFNNTMSATSPAAAAAPASAGTEDKTKVPGVLEDRLVTFTAEQFHELKNAEQKKMEALAKELGNIVKTPIEQLIERFAPKSEVLTPSSMVDDSRQGGMKRESFDQIAGRIHALMARETNYVSWKLDKEQFMQEFGWKQPGEKKMEAVTMTAPINYDRQIIAVPGGRFRVPLRQFTVVKQIKDADRFTFFTGDSFDFAAITEGTAPSDTTVTLTQVTATPATRGVLVKVNYSSTESAPADILEYINGRGLLAAIDDESADIMSVGTSISSPTNWVNGNTGVAITADTTFGTTNTLTITGVAAARRLIDNQGDVPGGQVFITNPKAYYDLLISAGIDKLIQQGMPQIALTGVLEQLIGMRIVISKAAAGGDSTSKRSLVVTPGQSMGLGVQRELMYEADRRNELQQIFVTPTQRIKSAMLDEKSTTRVSTSA
jgi:ribosomal protein L12E/L44/L45/RPP1/RPP2